MEQVGKLVRLLSEHGILISADLSEETLNGVTADTLAPRIIEKYADFEGLKIADRASVAKIISDMQLEKAPVPAEYRQASDFKPYAAEISSKYNVSSKETEVAGGTVDGFVAHFKDRLARIKELLGSQRAGASGMTDSLSALSSFSDGREVTVVGMVSKRITTKKGNVLMVIEDETGEAKIMFMNGTSAQAKKLFESSRHIIDDEVLAVNGKISGPFVIAKEIIWPGVPIKQREQVDEDIGIAFISDTHVGSKFFMERNLNSFINWLNGHGDKKEIAGKIKYLVVGGDVVDGIGIYPGQDKSLTILDIYEQYRIFIDIIKEVPDYIETFIIPGNHDAVQRAEPQPALTHELLRDFKADNIHMIPNPSFLTLHGVETLVYHGTSLDSIIRDIPGMSYASPELAMIELLKRRHLSPIYGGNIIVPSRKDNLVIDRVPHILHMGHLHKNGLANYHGVDILNSGTWQAMTDRQEAQGHIPTPCVLPVYEAKEKRFTTINFSR